MSREEAALDHVPLEYWRAIVFDRDTMTGAPVIFVASRAVIISNVVQIIIWRVEVAIVTTSVRDAPDCHVVR